MSTGRPGVQAGIRDWAIAVCVSAVLLIAGLSENRTATDVDLLGYVLLLSGGLALAARRRAPVPVLAATG
ncbi:sensor histidine kinase, partial [Micromonospora azadirachtae]